MARSASVVPPADENVGPNRMDGGEWSKEALEAASALRKRLRPRTLPPLARPRSGLAWSKCLCPSLMLRRSPSSMGRDNKHNNYLANMCATPSLVHSPLSPLLTILPFPLPRGWMCSRPCALSFGVLHTRCATSSRRSGPCPLSGLLRSRRPQRLMVSVCSTMSSSRFR